MSIYIYISYLCIPVQVCAFWVLSDSEIYIEWAMGGFVFACFSTWYTLPKTNIAMENPPFGWYLQGNMGIFMGYVSFREGTMYHNDQIDKEKSESFVELPKDDLTGS